MHARTHLVAYEPTDQQLALGALKRACSVTVKWPAPLHHCNVPLDSG